jgi:hypothetical protein
MAAKYTDFSWVRGDDGTLTVVLTPPVPVGGWEIRFSVTKRFGGLDTLITKSCMSGYNNVSGVNVTNSGQGIFNVALGSLDTSGMEPGLYATRCERLTSGARTTLTEGYLNLLI